MVSDPLISRTVLVVCMRRIGDVLLATPIARSIKDAWPDAQVDMLVFSGTEGVLRGNPDLREVITVELQFDPARSASQRFDLAARLRPALHALIGLHVEIIEWTGDGDLGDEVLHGTPWKARRWRDLRV